MFGHRARPDCSGKRMCVARYDFRRTLDLRHWRWVERRGDGESWCLVRTPLGDCSREGLGDESHLDGGCGRVSWQACQFRSDLVLAKTRSTGWATDLVGCQFEMGVRSGCRLLRGLDAHRRRGLWCYGGDVCGASQAGSVDGGSGRGPVRRARECRTSNESIGTRLHAFGFWTASAF